MKGTPDNGQLMGEAPAAKPSAGRPFGMVYVPPGTFHMGPSDEDINFNYTARNKQVSINGFWMDATEITNNEYRQFVNWTRDSIALKELGFVKTTSGGGGSDSAVAVDWSKRKDIKYDQASLEKLANKLMIDAPD
ncbi:MAG: SUMF1/EgtB/PvdO family nonheme iron enzyme, partial [Chitinophagaceae bacterium]|nr:SUMF1/EgtB/PvdO family nonheme iron enzyme [Chitinophagaceae bacterium]